MGARGPAPTPTPILEARGSWRAKERAGELRYERGKPSCPSWLCREAKAEWKRLIRLCDAAGVLQLVDRAMLAAWCEAWAEFVEAATLLARQGLLITRPDGNVVRNPVGYIKNTAALRLISLADKFGFCPSARVRMRAVEEGREGEEGEGKSRFFRTIG